MFGRRAGGRVCASTAQEQAGQRQIKQASRRLELADGEEAHLDAALVDHGRPAPDADGEQDVVIDRDALEAHGAERRRQGEEVGAGAAWAQAQYVLAEKRRTWKRRLSTDVGLRETRMVIEE